MKIAISALCFALMAGGVLATLAPATPETDKLDVLSPIELSVEPLDVLSDPSQGLSCSELVDLGDCASWYWSPGPCDCDVPVPYGYCDYEGLFNLVITQCYDVLICGKIGYICS